MDNFKIFRRAAARSTKSGAFFIDPVESYRPLLATWLIEMTLSLGWHKKGRRSHYLLEDESFSKITGISVETDEDSEIGGYICIDGKIIDHTDKACAKILKSRLENFRKQPIRDELSLLKNIYTIGKMLGLNDAEMSIMCFAAVMDTFPAFNAAISSASFDTSQKILGSIIALVPESNCFVWWLTVCKVTGVELILKRKRLRYFWPIPSWSR